MKNDRDLQILICSANLGNANPDVESLSRWIPFDGKCLDVLLTGGSGGRNTLGLETHDEVDDDDDDNNNNSNNAHDENDNGCKDEQKDNGTYRQQYRRTTTSRTKYPIRRRTDLPPSYNKLSTSESLINSSSSQASVDFLELEPNHSDYTNDDQFDIIVIGMQEATFDPPDKEEIHMINGDTIELSEHDSSINGTTLANVSSELSITGVTTSSQQPSLSPSPKSPSRKKIITKQIRKLPTVPIKKLQALHGLTGPSRDHTKNYSDDFDGSEGHSSRDAADKDEIVEQSNEVRGMIDSDDPRYTISERRSANVKAPSNALRNPLNILKKASLDILNAGEWLDGTPVLHAMLDARLQSYRRIVSYQRGEMRLEVYAHRRQVDVEVLHTAAQNTGRAGLANKGGIVAQVLVNDSTKLSFITTHLEAHEGQSKYQIRCKTIADILEGTKPQKSKPDVTCTSHYSFFMGDLNFRTELPNCDELTEAEHKQQVVDYVAAKDWDKLNEIDELGRAIRNNECLAGFQTLFCNFPPTFKVQRQLGYEYNDKRRPSYTDRILWKPGHELDTKIRPLVYEPIDNFTSSDHKPIRCAFSVQTNQPFALRPKMARTKSKRGLGKKHNETDTSVVAHKERLNLFISEMKCEISYQNKQISSSPPDPYICLISDPEESLKFPSKSHWKLLKRKLFHRLGIKRNGEKFNKERVTDRGWPRTSIKKDTFTPQWDDEEIHVEIRTHRNDGSPINLSGAMLHLSVMDHHSGEGAVPLGSFSFNMRNMIQRCHPSSQESSRRILSQRFQSKGKVSTPKNSTGASAAATETGEDSDMGPHSRGLRQSHVLGRSIMNLFHRASEEHDVSESTSNQHDNDTSDYDPIVSVDVDENLVLNGVITGRIRCRIEGWWMDESTAKAFGQIEGLLNGHNAGNESKKEKRRKTKGDSKKGHKTSQEGLQTSDNSETEDKMAAGATTLNGTLFDQTSDGRMIMLQERKVPKSRRMST